MRPGPAENFRQVYLNRLRGRQARALARICAEQPLPAQRLHELQAKNRAPQTG